MDALFAQLSDVARSAGRFVMFDLKKYLPVLGAVCQKNCFDATVAAYLLNPLKNDYTYEDVAREQLGLMMDDKADEWTKSCYEAYTAYAASEKIDGKTQRGADGQAVSGKLRCRLFLPYLIWNRLGCALRLRS